MVYTVRIEPHPNQEKRDANDEEYRKKQLNLSWWLNLISGVGGGIAFLALVALIGNAILIDLQWHAMRESNLINKSAFDRAYRPYVGISGVFVIFEGHNKTSRVLMKDSDAMSFRIEIKNFGPVPGTNFHINWKIFIGDAEMPETKVADSPVTIFPAQAVDLDGIVGSSSFPDIQQRRSVLSFKLSAEYDGPEGHEKYCGEERYAPERNGFIVLGSNCP